MAKTNKISRHMTTVRVLDGVVVPGDHHAKPTGLYLMELRLRRARALPVPRRRLVVTMAHEDGPDDIPKPVKITFL